MKFEEAFNLIDTNNYNLYIIAGEEEYLAQKYIKKLKKKLHKNLDEDITINLDSNISPQDFWQNVESVPFFYEKNIIYIENPKFIQATFIKKEEDAFLNHLTNLPPFTTIILRVSDNLDKRKKINKNLIKCGFLVECEKLQFWHIDKYIDNELRSLNLKIEPRAKLILMEIISAMENISLGFLYQELKKLQLIVDDGIITKEILLQNFSQLPEASIFRMWDMLMEKKIAPALRLYEIQIKSGIHPLKILALLIKQVRQLILCKIALENRENIPQKLKVHPFIAEKIIKSSKNFSIKKLEHILEDLCTLDEAFKTGNIYEGMVESVLLDFVVD